MDYDERVVRLEVNMENLQEELTLLRSQIALLDRKIEEFREQALHRMDSLRDHTDALRDHTDALRDHTDRRLDAIQGEIVQLRRDHEKLIYWVTGFTVTNILAIAALVLKALGAF